MKKTTGLFLSKKLEEIAEELLRSVWTDKRIDRDQFVIHKSRIDAIVKKLRNISSDGD